MNSMYVVIATIFLIAFANGEIVLTGDSGDSFYVKDGDIHSRGNNLRSVVYGFCNDTIGFYYDIPTLTLTYSCIGCNGILPEGCAAAVGYFRNALHVVVENGFTSIGHQSFYGFRRMQDISIPDSVDTIDTRAFSHCTSLTSIDIPSSVKRIGNNTFYGCTGLKSITIPEGIESILEQTFYNCTSLEEVKLPSTLKKLEARAFFFCHSLAEIDIPDSVTYIGDFAFQNCTAMTSITLPSSLEYFGYKVFYLSSNLLRIDIADGNPEFKSIDGVFFRDGGKTLVKLPEGKSGEYSIPEGVEKIEDFAISNNEKLTVVNIPSTVTTIAGKESRIFESCPELTDINVIGDDSSFLSHNGVLLQYDDGSIYLVKYPCGRKGSYEVPERVQFISQYAFYGADGLTSVTFSDTVLAIYYEAFAFCTNLVSVKFGENLLYLGDYAFAYTGLTSVTIPGSMTIPDLFGEGVFQGCENLETVVIEEGAKSIGSAAFALCSKLKNVTIPDSLSLIDEYAFYECDGLETLTLPDTLETIGYSAFLFCHNLKSINIPSGLKSLGEQAFYECQSLESISLPALDEIPSAAFYNCTSLKNVTIADGVKTINNHAFTFTSSLEHISIPDSVTFMGDASLAGCLALKELTLPQSNVEYGMGVFAMNDYMETVVFSRSEQVPPLLFMGCYGLKNITLPETVKSIGEGAFGFCTSMTSFDVPPSVTSIEQEAFTNCKNLKFVTFSSGLQQIKKRAFWDCLSLTSVAIPDTVTYVRTGAFENCMSLENVTFASDDTNIESEAFMGCKNLVNINLPSNMKKISKGTFSGCSSLPYPEIPTTVKTIEESAFAGCLNFTNVTIPSNVEKIESYAFSGCTNLESVTIDDGVTNIGSDIFEGCKSLTRIVIPGSVEHIESNAFDGLDSLDWIDVDTSNTHFVSIEGVLYETDSESLVRCPPGKIGNFSVAEDTVNVNGYAFRGCSKLLNIAVPSSVKNIGMDAFDGLSQLSAINVDENNEVYSSNDGVLYSKDGKTLLRCPEGKKGSYEIQAETETIRDEAFKGCSQLTSVTIADGVTSIGARSFSNCVNLDEVVIPGSVTSIGVGAYEGCSGLSKVTIESGSLTSISESTFKGCSKLSVVELPANINSIKNETFSGCSELQNIALPDNLESIGSNTFYGSGLTTITVPSGVSEIASDTFAGCQSLCEIHVADGNTVYKSDGGVLCDKKTDMLVQLPKAWSGEFTLPDSVTVIDSTMFSGCYKLTAINIPYTVSEISEEAFKGCSGLTSINVHELNAVFASVNGVLFNYDRTILKQYPAGRSGSYEVPEGTEELGVYSFKECSDLTGVKIPSSVKTIGPAAFARCTNLRNVDIQSGVVSLGDSIFAYCSSLESVTIPASVMSIGFSAFLGCKNLISVTYEGDLNPCVDSDDIDTFEGCESMKYVCLPMNYLDSAFCNRTDFCKSDSCADLQFDNNHCYEEVCRNGDKVKEQRENATIWEKRSTGCVECQCNDAVGPIQWSRCNSTQEHKFMCLNEGCLIRDQAYSVEIDFDHVKAIDLNTTELRVQLEILTGLEITDVGLEIGDETYVVHVVVIVEDEDVGELIVEAVNTMDKGEGCEYGSLCTCKNCRLIVNSRDLSSAFSVHGGFKTIVYVTLFFYAIFAFYTRK